MATPFVEFIYGKLLSYNVEITLYSITASAGLTKEAGSNIPTSLLSCHYLLFLMYFLFVRFIISSHR